MMPNREGLFHAYPVAVGLAETRENKLLQVVIQYRLFEELLDGQWTDCAGEHMEITGYHILEKRDRSLNDNTIEALKAALGWDGRDPFWLQDSAEALAQQPVQVKLAMEEYNGQQSLKVAFLNPYGAKAGGVPKADDDLRRSVGNRLGAKFRAYAGGTPANPPKPAGRPAAPAGPRPAPSKSAAPAAPKAPVTATMEDAWTEFTKHCLPPKWDHEATEKEWFRILAELFPGRQPDALSGADWAVMAADGPGKIIPF
ncbi:MAG: hypothetical protein WC869_14610 [Phycisphaerae bacterium]|jgi:hypothetical protein